MNKKLKVIIIILIIVQIAVGGIFIGKMSLSHFNKENTKEEKEIFEGNMKEEKEIFGENTKKEKEMFKGNMKEEKEMFEEKMKEEELTELEEIIIETLINKTVNIHNQSSIKLLGSSTYKYDKDISHYMELKLQVEDKTGSMNTEYYKIFLRDGKDVGGDFRYKGDFVKDQLDGLGSMADAEQYDSQKVRIELVNKKLNEYWN